MGEVGVFLKKEFLAAGTLRFEYTGFSLILCCFPGKTTGIPIHVFGTETHMTAIVGMALGHRPIPNQPPAAAHTANFLLNSSGSTSVWHKRPGWRQMGCQVTMHSLSFVSTTTVVPQFCVAASRRRAHNSLCFSYYCPHPISEPGYHRAVGSFVEEFCSSLHTSFTLVVGRPRPVMHWLPQGNR